MSEPSVRCFRKVAKLSGTTRWGVILLQRLIVKFPENSGVFKYSNARILSSALDIPFCRIWRPV